MLFSKVDNLAEGDINQNEKTINRYVALCVFGV